MKASGYFAQVTDLLQAVQATVKDQPLDLDEAAERVARRLIQARDARNKVLLVGNGGSAAIVSHMHSDLMKSVGVRALVFHDTPLLTATTNDDGYQSVFAEPVSRWAEPGDVLIAVSSSGQSPNILAAADTALALGAELVSLTGFAQDNALRGKGSVNFYVPSDSYGAVEGIHTLLTHFLTDRARELRS